MVGFDGGFRAAMMRSQTSQLEQTPITAASLLPPRVPCAKPWQRVLVTPATGLSRQRKIWKRVDGISSVVCDKSYMRAFVELESQGQGSRKCPRRVNHVPVWGDARWDTRVGQPHDGKWDLVEARAAVAVTKRVTKTADIAITTGHGTFPEDNLKWVPRKRHNSRRPIEPKKAAVRMVADLQPLIEFDVPVAVEPVDATHQVDEKQMRRRSTRRLSRRISLGPGDISPRKICPITLSPAKTAAPALSPMKRPPVARSPQKVAESPLRSFKVNATPTKVILESPKAILPLPSPAKALSSPLVEEVPSSVPVADHLPLVFDQPVMDISSEPEHESRRRLSLKSARRSERRSSGILRLINFENVREAPNRRHSFNSARDSVVHVKGRRSTLDVFCEGPDEARNTSTVSDVDTSNLDQSPEISLVEAEYPVFKVDAAANFDIFGQAQRPVNLVPSKQISVQDASTERPTASLDISPIKDMPPVIPSITVSENATLVSPVKIASGVTEVAVVGETPLDQAAMCPRPDAPEAEQHESSPEPTPQTSTFEDSSDTENEMEQDESKFEHQDPEGLSTIYEESFAMEAETTRDVTVEPPTSEPIIATQSCASPTSPAQLAVSHAENPQGTTSTSFLFGGVQGPVRDSTCNVGDQGAAECGLGETAIGDIADEQLTQIEMETQVAQATEIECSADQRTLHADSLALANHVSEVDSPRGATEVCTNHVVTASDALSESDSPERLDEGFIIQPSRPFHLEKGDDDASSPSPSEESVLTPENDFCIAGSLEFETKEQHDDPASDVELPNEMQLSPSHNEDSPEPIDTRRLTPSSPQHSHSPRRHVSSSPGLPGTPNHIFTTVEDLASPEDGLVVATSSPRSESSGFTPINGRQISPPMVVSTIETFEQDPEIESIDLIQEDEGDIVITVEDEITETIEDDLTLTVEAPYAENDTLALQAMHEDSETEMLRKFVTRVAADKNAKAAAAAAALAKKSARPKRRSGSTGSSSTGSPIAKTDTPHKRKPLREKSANSPSPVKKRKLAAMGDDGPGKIKDDTQHVSEESVDAPKLKRRRRRIDPVLDATPEDLAASMASLDSDPASSGAGPRRSTRSRSSRVALKPNAPSANSIALSMIPVRLPGMGSMEEMIEPQFTVRGHRGEEKDLAAVTRVNTRKNKGNSVPPKLILAQQAEDPAAWRMKELKGVFDAKESRAAEATEEATADGRKSRHAKGVRWAEELVRYQGEEAPTAFKTMASSLFDDIIMADAAVANDIEELAAAASQPVLPVEEAMPAEPAEKSAPAPAPVKKALPRRTRSSKLQAPTPVKKIVEKRVAAVPPTPVVHAPALPKVAVTPPAASRPTAAAVAAAASSSSSTTTGARTGMATRRPKIAKLGMGVNGTPAPKRRGRAAT
ncbi:hypothetical protein B0H67DRAFT_1229 [Lasiosphaeris hirsuta]|uniref:Uncharacterized protein n=1 Tax=Lasiosphaeris hirsuta TaxID=260670 RepID=A0AA40E763_9PEZI|nr:hypothetical protein B0H67DRAFT_1229 [Lasiosphaeris hirsuta]